MSAKSQAATPTRVLIQASLLTGLLLLIVLAALTTIPAFDQLMDFGSFVASSREASLGSNPYSSSAQLVFQVESRNFEQTLPSPNLNPPASLLFFAPLAKLEPLRAANGWRIASLLLYMLGICIMSIAYPKAICPTRVVWALAPAGLWHTIAVGQIYVPLLLLIIGAWILYQHGYSKSAGIVLGFLIAIKPNFMLWLILLAASNMSIIVISAIITGLVLSILPLFIYGTSVYSQWLHALSQYPSAGLLIAGNSSFQSLTARLGFSTAGSILSVFFAILLIWFVYRNRQDIAPRQVHALGIVGSILMSPFSWVGYTILTLPVFLSIKNWGWKLTLAACLLIFPYIGVLFRFQKSLLQSVLFGWMYGWGLVFIVLESIGKPVKA